MRSALMELLSEIDNEFDPRLSSRIDVPSYVDKILENSTIIPVYNNGNLDAFIAFYCNDYKSHASYLTMLAVRKSYRKRGVGKLLVETAIKFLEETTFRYFKLEVDKSNSSAFAVYKKLGFSIIDESTTAYLMQKKLSNA